MDTNTKYEFTTEYLVNRFLDDIIRLAMVYVKNTDDAKDIAQQVFVIYLQKKPEFKEEKQAKNWLFRVTSNLSKNHRYRHREDVDFYDLENVLFTDTIEEHEKNKEYMQVFRAVMSLKPIYREVIHMHYYLDYPCERIAQILNLPEGTVYSRLVRARKLLENILKGGLTDD